MTDLHAYLCARCEWVWSWCDCTVWNGDWVEKKTGYDPCATLRGTYGSAEEANAIIDAYGGLEGLLTAHLEPRFHRASDVADGDVGIVTALTGFDASASFKQIPAIKFGPLWGVMSARGPKVMKLDWSGIAWRIA